MKKKITRMSDSEFLCIDQENGHTDTLTNDEVRTGSITPTTFQSKEFEQSLNDIWYKDTYSYNQYSVVKFGINERSTMLNLPSSSIASKEESESSKLLKTRDIKNINFETVEINILEKAIDYLSDNRMVLVNIFARTSGGKIKSDGTLPEVHTVVLYKNNPDTSTGISDIIVIDPSNSAFSSHLSKFNDNRLNGCSWKISTLPIDPQKILKIYEAPSEVPKGTNFDEYRNCTDIAVKIAFGLQTLSDGFKISVNDLCNSSFIKNLSNIDDINPHIFYDKIEVPTKNGGQKICNHPTRIQQASDPELVSMFHLLERTIDNEVKILDEFNLISNTLIKLGLNSNRNSIDDSESLDNHITNISKGDSNINYQGQLSQLQLCYRNCSEVIDDKATILLGTGEWT